MYFPVLSTEYGNVLYRAHMGNYVTLFPERANKRKTPDSLLPNIPVMVLCGIL